MTALKESKDFVVLGAAAACGTLALLLAHTIYVTTSTYWYGEPLAVALIISVWTRLRRRASQMSRSLRITSNAIIALLTLEALTYLIGIATWYK